MYIIIFISCGNKKEAGQIARALVGQKLVACVNMIKNVESVFWWEGKSQRAEEVLLVSKSKKIKLPKIIRLVKSMHSYQVPEIICLPIIAGYKPYLDWIDESLR